MGQCPLKTVWEGHHWRERKTRWIHSVIYECRLFQRGSFWRQPGLRHQTPQEDDRASFFWSGCSPCFLLKGWPTRRYPREALLPTQASLILLTMSWHLQLHMHLMSSSLPTVWVASILWINEEILHATSQLYVQSALTWGHLPCFFLFATRHPPCAPPIHTWGQVLQRSWLLLVCRWCFSWANHRQGLEDSRGMAWRLSSPSWHLLLAVFFIVPFLTDLLGCGQSVLLTDP